MAFSVLPAYVVASRRAEFAARHRLLVAAQRIAEYETRKAAYAAKLAAEAEAQSLPALLERLALPMDPYQRVMLENEITAMVETERRETAAMDAYYLRVERDGV